MTRFWENRQAVWSYDQSWSRNPASVSVKPACVWIQAGESSSLPDRLVIVARRHDIVVDEFSDGLVLFVSHSVYPESCEVNASVCSSTVMPRLKSVCSNEIT